MLAELETAIQTVSPFLDGIVEELAGKPDWFVDRDYDLGPNLLFREYSNLKEVAKYFAFSSFIRAERSDIEGALKERKTAIRDVDVLLTDASSEVSGERLQEARAALSKGDFSKADEIFAEIEASAQAAVQSAARAAYGRGEIAKEQIRWADAAAHYARAAGLDPTYDALLRLGSSHGAPGATRKRKILARS